jgi:hypothetical protein
MGLGMTDVLGGVRPACRQAGCFTSFLAITISEGRDIRRRRLEDRDKDRTIDQLRDK